MKELALLFDLDGTITDSGPGILNSVRYAFTKLDWPIPSEKALYAFVGPPLKDSFMGTYQMDEETAEQAIKYYREYYIEKGIYENLVYEGLPELLQELRTAQVDLYLATSKPEVFAKKILRHFGLAELFNGIYGASLDDSRSQKGEVIRYALKEANLSPTQAWMIGDRSHDVLGAKENHLTCIGVLYGYGDYQELKTAGAAYIVETPQKLRQFLLQTIVN